MLSVEQIEQRLKHYRPQAISEPTSRRAAVAMLLFSGSAGLEVLFIRRTEFAGDPWSGDLAFPGGGVDAEDAGPRAAAERETLEEIGLQLTADHYLGQLDDLTGAYLSVRISCFVYLLPDKPRLRYNEEVGDSFWVPLAVLLEPERNERARFSYRGAKRTHPVIQLPEWSPRPLWGITYRLVQNFLQLFDLSFNYPETPQTLPARQNTPAH